MRWGCRRLSHVRLRFAPILEAGSKCGTRICGTPNSFDTLRHSKGWANGEFIMAEENKSFGLAWFLAGLGVGALVGILYAPKSGRETREDLISGAREGTEYLRNRTHQVAEQMGDLVDQGKEQMGEYVDRGRAQWEEFVERGKNMVT